MCGIAGIIMHKKNAQFVDSTDLSHYIQEMTNMLAHRGPDGEGYWKNSSGDVAFGHRRLAVIDLTNAAAQPMHYQERYTIVYNGEIYNYIEIKEELYKKGYRFETRSDTEVIIAAYDYWKEKCLQQFDGMFSFAIWDEKQKTLFAARDRFGEKPFYYFNNSEHLIFASEMKALWAVGVPKKVDEKMLLNYLTIGHMQNPIDKEQTFFEDVISLPPAHYLQLNATGHLTIKHYWELDKETKLNITADDAIERFTALLTTSVKRRLRSDVTVGTSLSGGLDSSTIVSLMRSLRPDNKRTVSFSAVFPGFEKDESAFISTVSNSLKIENFQVEPTADSLIKDLEKLCYYQEEPFSSSSIYVQYKVFELAKRHNVKVLLDGQGADETLAGYHKYCHWYLQQLISRGSFTTASREKTFMRKNNIPITWSIKNYFAAYLAPHTAIQLERKEYSKITTHRDITRSFVSSLRGREWEGIRKPIVTKLNDILYFNTIDLGLEDLLRFADRNSMAHGREVRLPFLSHELVEFLFTLPANYKIQDGWTKWLLRKAMDKRLPDSITWRKDKIGYEPPQEQWMTNPILKEYLHEAKRKLVNKGILKKQVLNQKIIPMPSYDPENYDWRYLISSQLL